MNDCVDRPPRSVRFALGAIVATPGALRALQENQTTALPFIERHASGDWGDVCAADARANERALIDGDRLVSAYVLPDGERLLVVTEADRSVTTALLLGEY